jgi:hypothetical protein
LFWNKKTSCFLFRISSGQLRASSCGKTGGASVIRMDWAYSVRRLKFFFICVYTCFKYTIHLYIFLEFTKDASTRVGEVEFLDCFGDYQTWKLNSFLNWRWCTKAWVSIGIRDPSSPRRKRWIYNIFLFIDVKVLKSRLSSITARLKFKEIDGDSYKRWSMWFNLI